MISSSDELKLLIKKWIKESTQVAIFSASKGPSGRRAIFYIEGIPRLEEPSNLFAVRNENSFATLALTDSRFGYIRFEDKPELLTDEVEMGDDWFQPTRYDEAILVAWPDGENAVIVTIKTVTQD